MKKLIISILSLVLIISLFPSCSGIKESVDDGRLTVVTTIFPVYDWTINITGDLCNVVYLDKNGTDMHSFEPTASVIATISSADIFIHNGGVSDKWVDSALTAAGNKNLIRLSLMGNTELLEEETAEGMQTHDHENHNTDEYDEHIWLSLKKAQTAVDVICETLCEADSVNEETYRTNAKDYKTQLIELDNNFTSVVSSAERNTILVADRFPFRYLTEDYGIEYFAAFPGCSAESEASFDTMTFLIDKTKELNLPVILVTENQTTGLAETISNETGSKILALNSCQAVKQENIDNGLTYLSAMEENLRVLTEALS